MTMSSRPTRSWRVVGRSAEPDPRRKRGRAWAYCRGRPHQVTTAVAAFAPNGRLAERTVETRVRFQRLSDTDVEDYTLRREWNGKAGGYAIQGRAGRFVVAIQGSYSAVVGLPLYETVSLLEGWVPAPQRHGETILVNVGIGEVRIATIDERGLSQLAIERLGGAQVTGVGAIYLGRVTSVVPGMEAAFVDIGTERSGFLSAWDARPHDWVDEDGQRRAPPIADLVHEGQAVIVQATKEPLADKGARLSTRVSIPGRYLVFVPDAEGVFISRRIEDEAERTRLTDVVSKIAADRISPPVSSFERPQMGRRRKIWRPTSRGWRNFGQKWRKRAKHTEPPAALYSDLGPVERFLRDHIGAKTATVLIDDAAACTAAQNFVTNNLPDFEGAVEQYQDQDEIFDAHASPSVWVPVGPEGGVAVGRSW